MTYHLTKSAREPSKELAWLVGYLLGDGYFTRGWVIGMKTKDRDLKDFYIKNFEQWSEHSKFCVSQRKKHFQKFSNGTYCCKPVWSVRACFKEAYFFLRRFKNRPLYSLEFFPKKHWRFILKGLWDSEGCMTLRENNNRIQVSFVNSNERILRLYEKLCLSLGFSPRSRRSRFRG